MVDLYTWRQYLAECMAEMGCPVRTDDNDPDDDGEEEADEQ